MITRVKSVFLYVADQERSYDFYVNKLGFKVHTDAEMRPGARWLEVIPPHGQTTITLAAAKDFDRSPGEGSSGFTFSTDDAQQLYQELKANNVEVTEPVTEPWATFLHFIDPDGHRFLVTEGD